MQEIEYEGQWWLPGEYNDRVGGIAKYELKEGVKLETFEEFDSVNDTIDSHERIIGESKTGDQITLQKCKRTYINHNHSGGIHSTNAVYKSDRMIVGDYWFGNNKNLSFDKLMISFPLLNEWSQLTSPASQNVVPE